MALTIWKEVGKTNAIRSEVGSLTGNDSSVEIVCTAAPVHVRSFSSATEHGQLLVEDTDYTISSATITLDSAPATGTMVVAFSAGEYIFEDLTAQGNTAVTADRTLEQQIFIAVDDINATDIVVSLNDYLAGSGLATSSHYLAADNSGSPDTYESAGASLTVGDKADESVTPIWVKAILPENTNMNNYHDIYIKAEFNAFSTNL